MPIESMPIESFATHSKITMSGRIATLTSIAVLTSIACFAAAVADTPSDPSSVAAVTKLERKLEQVYNSPAFAKNPSIALAYYDGSDAMRMFDIMLPIEYRGKAFRDHIIALGNQFPGGKVEFLAMEVTADRNMAFATSLQHFSGTGKDGKPYDMTMRVTDCLRKSDGHWLIVHEHVSLPLDPATFVSVITKK